VPESKHRRKGKYRPRPRQVEGQKTNPTPSPPWVPGIGAGLLGLGVLVILLGYFTEIQGPVFGPNFMLIVGFVFLALGFGFLTQWR